VRAVHCADFQQQRNQPQKPTPWVNPREPVQAGLAIKWNYRVWNLAVDAKVFMHWRFGTGYLCPWTADLTKGQKKKFVSLGAAVNGFLPNQSANFDRAFFSTLGNKMVDDVLHEVDRLARLRG